MIDFQRGNFGATTGTGRFYNVILFGSEAANVPFQAESGVQAVYTVPANTKISAKSLLVTTDRSWCATPGVTAQAGIARLRLNGADAMEFRIHETGWWIPPGSLQWKHLQRRGGGFNMRDMAFAAGDVLVLRFTGASSTACYLVNADISGMASGAAVCTSNRQVISGNTATDVVTYTVPVGGFTLKRLGMTAQVRGGPELPFITVRLNGSIITETPTFRAVDSMGVPPRIAIPLHGLDLYPGDRITVDASCLWLMDEFVTLTVMGNASSISSGVYPTPAEVRDAVWAKVLPGTDRDVVSPPNAANYADEVWKAVIP